MDRQLSVSLQSAPTVPGGEERKKTHQPGQAEEILPYPKKRPEGKMQVKKEKKEKSSFLGICATIIIKKIRMKKCTSSSYINRM